MLPVVILAGGLATRLYPLTDTVPKALIQVAGKPFIFHQLEYLKSQNVTDVVICIGYLGEKIKELVGNGNIFGINIDYSDDGKKLLGTGGALKKALRLLDESFFVLYGDTFLPINFNMVMNAYLKKEKSALMAVFHNVNKWDRSNVLFLGGKLVEYNKHTPKPEMNHIDYGLSVISSKIFDKYAIDTKFDLSDLFTELSKAGELAGYEVKERFYEIGTHLSLKETEEYFFNRREKE